MHFRLAGDDAPAPVRAALEWLARALAADPRLREDRRRLAAILKLDPEEICRRQCRCRN
jgi:hypothetical protein